MERGLKRKKLQVLMQQFHKLPLLLRTVLEYYNAEPPPMPFENGFTKF